MTSLGLLVFAGDDLLDAGVAEADDLTDRSSRHAGGCGFADRFVAFRAGVRVALGRSFEALVRLHKSSVENLTSHSKLCSFLHMSTAQRIQELIVYRARKGNDPIQSSGLLGDLIERHTGPNLVAALVHHSFATEKDAQRFVKAIGAAR